MAGAALAALVLQELWFGWRAPDAVGRLRRLAVAVLPVAIGSEEAGWVQRCPAWRSELLVEIGCISALASMHSDPKVCKRIAPLLGPRWHQLFLLSDPVADRTLSTELREVVQGGRVQGAGLVYAAWTSPRSLYLGKASAFRASYSGFQVRMLEHLRGAMGRPGSHGLLVYRKWRREGCSALHACLFG